jgi:hypothetical protein
MIGYYTLAAIVGGLRRTACLVERIATACAGGPRERRGMAKRMHRGPKAKMLAVFLRCEMSPIGPELSCRD